MPGEEFPKWYWSTITTGASGGGAGIEFASVEVVEEKVPAAAAVIGAFEGAFVTVVCAITPAGAQRTATRAGTNALRGLSTIRASR